MNYELTNQIIRHVYHCLGLRLPDKKTNIYSIMQPEFLTDKKISFEDGAKNNVWAVEFQTSKKEESEVKLILADMSQDNVPEYALLVTVKDSPSFACYLTYAEYNLNSDEDVYPPMIACCLQQASWSECNVYLQASFLCGMEKIKDISSTIKKSFDENLYLQLISFIQYYQNTTEQNNEGQEGG